MSSDFLKCIICPKLPTFSDSSHLLTHVGSKGHLAHLHRLQVRSHQEPEAANKVLVYNQWYTDHGVAQLLSERLSQKEAKQANKQTASQRQSSTVNAEKKRTTRKRNASKQSSAAETESQDETLSVLKTSESQLVDIDLVSIEASRDSSYPALLSSPFKSDLSLDIESIDDKDHVTEQNFDTKFVSASPQLKGTVWPGMGLFDAATVESQRKRNQKKDASVLKRLEALSGIVDPHETIHSTLGNVLKRRHMDNLENDTPVEGEVLLEPPTPKRQRISRSKSVKTVKKGKEKRRPGRPRHRHDTSPLASPDNLVTSDAEDTSKKLSCFSPSEEETREFKLAIRNARPKKKKGNFLIFEDSSPNFGVDGSSEQAPSMYIDTSPLRGRVVHPSITWTRIQNDVPDPFKPLRSRTLAPPLFENPCHNKENINPFHESVEGFETGQLSNPLSWGGCSQQTSYFNPLACHVRHGTAFNTNYDPFDDDDTFMPVRNPLTVTFGYMTNFEDQAALDPTDSPGFSYRHRQPLFAP